MDATHGAVNLARLAREIAMDILPVEDILAIHKVDDDTWTRIQADERWQAQLASMVQDWNAAANAKERVKVKAQTGMETLLEVYIADAADPQHPLAQRVEAGKLVARLGELMENQKGGSGGQVLVQININGKQEKKEGPAPTPVIDLDPVSPASLAKVTGPVLPVER